MKPTLLTILSFALAVQRLRWQRNLESQSD